MEGPRNNLNTIKTRTDAGRSAENRDGKTKIKSFKFNVKSPEKPKSIYPSLPPNVNNGTTSGRGASPIPSKPFNLHKTMSLNLETAISKPNSAPIRSAPTSPSPNKKRSSPDASSSLNKRVKRDNYPAESTRVNIPGPSLRDESLFGGFNRFDSPPVSRVASPTKSTIAISTTTATTTRHTEISRSSKLDQMSMDKLLRLKSSRQSKALTQADVLVKRLKSRGDYDLDLIEDQYALFKKSVKEVEDAISRRGGANTSTSSSYSSPISISSPGDCYDLPTKPLFASPTKDVFDTSWVTTRRSPIKRPQPSVDTTFSSASVSTRAPSTLQSSSEICRSEVEDPSLWEGMDEPDHNVFQARQPSPPRRTNMITAADDEFRDKLSFGKSPIEDHSVADRELHAKYSDDARYKEAMQVLRRVFKKQEFRHHQLEAIMATLSGQDVFILMPTGGGKSLCYQLPAICTTGTTRGVSIVISPLMALMEDQVQGLKDLGIDAAHVNSDMTEAEARETYSRLRSHGSKPTVLYVSPEKLEGSQAIQGILASLYSRNEIARFVIDEAHVTSLWGRSFRDAYRGLRTLRTNYPTVPIMALTATATDKIVKDIIFQLQMKEDTVRLKQSFNRPNLSYTVFPKIPNKKNMSQNIAQWIKTTHPGAVGIIYCLSRDNCKEVADDLQNDHGISAHHYHAGLEPAERRMIQRKWQNGEILVIVATIAFGMGIDKSDVRFVIHHSLPKDLSGYYQETGRAGRDGKPSDCVLYYAWRDVTRLDNMVQKDEKLSDDERQRQRDEARQVARYCMLDIDCRRQYVLQYFGERFDRQGCQDGCDNCISGKSGTHHDLTREARGIVGLVKDLENKTLTRLACIQIFRGSITKDFRNREWDTSSHSGKGSHWDQNTTERVVNNMILEGILQEYSEKRGSYFFDYIRVGDAKDLLSGKRTFEMEVSEQKEARGKGKGKGGGRNAKKNTATVASVNRTVVEEITCFEDDDDDLGKPIEHYARSRTNAGGSSSTSRVTAVTRTTAAVSSKKVITIDEEDDCDLDEPSLINELHVTLCDLRAQIAKSRGQKESEILSNECVEMIALTIPKDRKEFEDLLQDSRYEEDFIKYVMDHYGMRFLNLCVKEDSGVSILRLRKKVDPLNKAEMKSRFAFDDAAQLEKATKKGGIRGMDV